MKKVYVLLMFVAFCGLLAAVDVLLVNYTFSPEGELFMQELQNYVRESDWTRLTDSEKPGDICIFVKEYFIPKGIDPELRNFTVTFAVVEEPFGDYSEYVPLSKAVSGTWYVGTESFLIHSKDVKNGLWEAIDRIDTELYLFLATYSNIVYAPEQKPWIGVVEKGKLYRIDADTGYIDLFAAGNTVRDFVWEKGGQSLLYVEGEGYDIALWRLTIDGLEAELLSEFTAMPDFELNEDEAIYTYLYLFPDGSLYCRFVYGDYFAADEQVYAYLPEDQDWMTVPADDYWELYANVMRPPEDPNFLNMDSGDHRELFYVGGEEPRRLTYTDYLVRELPEEYMDIDFTLSPDKSLLLCMVPLGMGNLNWGPSFLVDLNGMQIELSPYPVRRFAWTPDNRLVYAAWIEDRLGEQTFALALVGHDGVVKILKHLDPDSEHGLRVRALD
ncbi:MAG: hypothetical protein U1B83_05435 [Candidatus Cloacimonadaceae bacterium]|nr:hypothetical protein [Candidatus Cloacimonadaceae bacterium]